MITVTYTRRQVLARLLLPLFLFSLFLWLSCDLTSKALDILPDGSLYTGSALDFGTLTAAGVEAQESLLISGQASVSSTVGSAVDPGRIEPVTLVCTDGAYPQLHRLRLISGVFFPSDSAGVNAYDAVISTDLAFALFGTLDNLVGRPVLVGSTELTVVGVYAPKEDLLSRLSSDGRETVFVPYYSAALDAPPSVKLVTVREVSGHETVDVTAVAELNSDLNGLLDAYRKTDLHTEKTLLHQRLHFTLFFAGGLTSVYFVAFLCKLMKVAVRWLRDARKRFEPVRAGDIVKRFLPPLLLAVTAAAILRLTAFSLYLPFQLTAENILRPGFYLDYAVGRVQQHNLYGCTFYGNISLLAACSQLALGLLALVTLCRFFSRLYRLSCKILLEKVIDPDTTGCRPSH